MSPVMPQEKWDFNDVWSVLEYYRWNYSYGRIGKIFGVSRNAIAGIIDRNLPPEERKQHDRKPLYCRS